MTLPKQAMQNPSKWAIHEVRGLPTFVSGRVALLGDAVSLYRMILDLTRIDRLMKLACLDVRRTL